jgi:polyphosphate kinase
MPERLENLSISPHTLKSTLLEMIEAEARMHAKPASPPRSGPR